MVLVNVNGTVYSVNLTGGRGQLNITNLLSGNYSVNVTLIENEKYLSNSNKTSFTVSKRDSFLNVVTMPIATGENEVIRFTLPGDATGNITVTVDKVIHTVAVSGGAGILVISNLHQGIYTVNATYNGDNKYNRYVNDPQSFRVIQHSDEMDIVDEGNRTVLVHLNENATGNVTIEINGEVYNATVINGTATIILTDTVPGIHRAHVKFNSNSTEFEDKEAIAELFVPKYTTPITVEVSEFKVDDAGYINVTLPHDATGMVIVEVNGKSFNTTDIVNGVARFAIANLTSGNKTFVVEYLGDNNYQANATAGILTVNKHNSGISVAAGDIQVDESLQINVTGPEDISGVVVVNIDGNNYTVLLVNGTGSVNVSKLANGTYNIKAQYLENTKYLSSSDNATVIKVSKVTPDISAEADNITEGENAVFEITLPLDATGTVTITVNGTQTVSAVTGGINKVLVEKINVGEYNVSITYSGNDKYTSANTTVSLKVKEAKPPVGEGIQITDLGNGTIRVTAPGNASGNVTVIVGGDSYNTTLVNGSATLDLVNATPGIQDIVVIYRDADNNTVEFNSSVNIPKYTTPIRINVSDSAAGASTVITVITDGNITGNITVEINARVYSKAPDSTGRAVFEIEGLTAGNKTVTATYAGDDLYSFNSTTAHFAVLKLSAPLSVSAQTLTGAVLITLSDLPDDAEGIVVVRVAGMEYAVDLAVSNKITVPIAQTGNYQVNATYLGNDKYMGNSSSTSFHITVGEENVTIEIKNTTVGNNLTVKVTVPQDAEGNITVRVGDTVEVVKVTGGENIITVPGLEEGEYTVNVTYSGDDTYDSKTVIKTVHVLSSINSEENLMRGWNSPYDYYAEFLDNEGHVLKNTVVQITVNGKTYSIKTDNEGIAYLTACLDVGSYEALCINPVTGQTAVHGFTIIKRIVENVDVTMDFKDGTKFTVRAIGDDGKPVDEGEFVDIWVNGIHYACRTNKDGYSSLDINLNPKKYTITAEYKKTLTKNNLVVKQTLKLVKKTVTVKKGNSIVLSAQLKWSNGKAIKSKKVTFKFNGKSYSAKTNSKGIAKVTVKKSVSNSLKKGKYSYTAKYITDIVKGTVKIK